MSKELLLIADAVANEKSVPRHIIFEALEGALAAAKRKQLAPEEVRVRVSVDQKDGSIEVFRQWEVVADDAVMDDPAYQIRLMDALDEDPGAEVGDTIEEGIEAPDLGRVAAQTAKQIIIQKVRESEREQIRNAWADRVGEMVIGTVKRYERNQAYLDLGNNAEGILQRSQLIQGERVRIGDRVRAVLTKIDPEVRGPQLVLSRTSPELLRALFAIEIPEVGQGTIEVMAVARDAGHRAKVAVMSHDKRVDPIGACIGMRGSRIQAITNELAGERVDIILWNENAAEFVISAMAPAEIEKIVMNEETRSMELGVSGEKLAMAIGRGGQNVRLASQLTGWQLTVMSTEDMEAKAEAEAVIVRQRFVDELEVDEEIADILAGEGFTTIDEVAYVAIGELLVIDGFDEDIANALQGRAREALLDAELRKEEASTRSDLLEVEGVEGNLADALIGAGIENRQALADLATDELLELDIEGITQAQAGALILAAREGLLDEAA